MKIKVKIHSNSSQEKIEEISGNSLNLEIWLKEKPIEGKANQILIKKLKKYFKPCKSISIVKGIRSKNKVIEVIK